jgi:hypothetical protein
MATLTISTISTLSLVCQIAYAQTPVEPVGAAGIAFDLPAQPLGQALEQYDARTSLSVFFPSELAAGRISSPVRGTFSPEQALRLLLQGTGLTVQAAAEQAFVLVLAPADAGGIDAQTAEPAPLQSQRAYDGLLQSKVMQMLCTRPDFALGQYRLALSVRVDAAGHVGQVRLLDTTGNARRDAAIVESLRRVDVGQAPANPGKPFVLLVEPRSNADAPACPLLH